MPPKLGKNCHLIHWVLNGPILRNTRILHALSITRRDMLRKLAPHGVLPRARVEVSGLPPLPLGTEQASVEVMIRVRDKRR